MEITNNNSDVNVESKRQIVETKIKHYKLEVIVTLLKSLKSDQLDLPKANKDNIEKAVVTLKINDILKLNNSSEQHSLLGMVSIDD